MVQSLSYYTTQQHGETEILIQKSHFLCQAAPIQSEAEAIQFIQEISKQHWDANHNCYAYRVTEAVQKSSDDGEPAGTAGRPMLELIHAKNLLYTGVVITRYLGRIKLGAGGLIRAYRQAALAAVNAAGMIKKSLHQQLILTFDYSLMGILEHRLRSSHYSVEEPQFTGQIQWPIWVPMGEENESIVQLRSWTQGQVQISKGETSYRVMNETRR